MRMRAMVKLNCQLNFFEYVKKPGVPNKCKYTAMQIQKNRNHEN
jgi:hypothetical protein